MNDRLIAERVGTLLAHYWTPEMDPSLRSHLASDWLDDLREFPASIVADAVRDYRQSEDHRRRPLPGDIRLRCIEIQRHQREDREREMRRRAIPDYTTFGDQRTARKLRYAEAAEAREQWAREHGCESFEQAMGIGLAKVVKRVVGAA